MTPPLSRTLLCILLCLLTPTLRAQQPSTEDILQQLDEAIANKARYREGRVRSIDSLKNVATYAQGAPLAVAYEGLCNLYRQYQSDSALHYIDRLLLMDAVRSQPRTLLGVLLSKAETLAVMGEYNEAEDILAHIRVDTVDVDLRARYYHACRTVYGWEAEYIRHASAAQNNCRAMTQLYRDSVLLTEPDKVSRAISMADNLICQGQPDSALHILSGYEEVSDGLQKAYVLFNMAEAYRIKNQPEKQIHYLALTALLDIQRGVTEYSALPMLATLINNSGDRERSYNYLFCSMEDANYCNARLRTIESSEMFPIIERNYQSHLNNQRRLYLIFFIVASFIAVLLVGGIVFLRREMQKLAATRSLLAAANDELQRSNSDLRDSSQIKEEYIMLYLNRCRSNMDVFEKFRLMLLRLAKNKQMDELLKQLKQAEPVKEGYKQFYDEFDKTFLSLHPRFVDDFNALLLPEARIVPKKGTALTPELRIFALVRLGISDMAQVAHFLDYSVATVYNYRSHIFQSSIHPKEDFEKHVMQLP